MPFSPIPPLRPRTQRTGFTLIELLAVIAVIALLTAIIISTVGSIRQKAWATQSLSNKRMIYTALCMYNADHNRLPPLTTADSATQQQWNYNGMWHTIIAPYFEHDEIVNGQRTTAAEAFMCPAQPIHNTRGDYGIAYHQVAGPIRKSLIDANGNIVGDARSLSLAEIIRPGHTPLLADCEQLNGAGETLGSYSFDPTRTSRKSASTAPRLSFRHDDEVQFIFADGSGGSYTVEEVYGEDGVLPWANE